MLDPIDALEKRLYNPSAQLRRFAADVLVEIGTPRAIQALINGYLSPVDTADLEDAFDSSICTVALMKVGAAAVPELIPFIGQYSVIWLLGQLQSEVAVDPIIAAYQPNAKDAYAIVSALGYIGSPRALPFLHQILADQTVHPSLRQWTDEAIRRIQKRASAANVSTKPSGSA